MGKMANCIVKFMLRVQFKVPRIVWAGSSYGGFCGVPLKAIYRGKAFSFDYDAEKLMGDIRRQQSQAA